MRQELLKIGKTSLTEGWRWANFVDCVDILDDKRMPVSQSERAKRIGSIPYFGANGQAGWIDDYIFDEEIVLLAEDGGNFFDKSKHVAYIITGKSWVNNHAHVLRGKKDILSNRFLCHYLNTVDYSDLVSGSTRFKLNQTQMKKIKILLPPFLEQQRIVDKLDKQMTQIEMMKKEAEEQMEAANNYYRSYLLKVFSEKDNWKYKKFGELFNTKYGLSKPSVRDSTKTKALRMTNINYEGELILDNICYLDLSDDELKQHKLKKNDLIFNRTNSADLVGKTTVFDHEDTFVVVSYLVVATPKTPEINSKFVSYYMNTSEMKKYFVENCDKAISQANFSASKLCEIQIPVPDKKTQDKIVGSIQTAKTELMKVSEPIKSQLDAIDQLPASILNEVFGQYQINS